MSDKKEVLYTLSLKITKISLKVRFPCKLSCSIKLDGQQKQIPGEKDLINGQVVMNTLYSINIFLPQRKEHVSQDKKCTLFIYLNSSSGKIPAGSLWIGLAKAMNQNLRQVSRVDKCPDKNALIQYELKLQRHEDKKDNTNASTLNKEAGSIKNIKLVKSVSPDRSQRHIVTSSHIQSIRQAPYLRRYASKKEEQSRISILESYHPERKTEPQKIFALEREIQNYKNKLMMAESEIASKNNRIGQIQKEMKALQKKDQQLQLQAKLLSSKIEYAEKANKDLILQIKLIKQKTQEEKLNFENIIKRLQIRQNSCKEQVKTITEKLYSSQNQKQRMVFQKNMASNDFEGRQKKIRQAFKEKEKKMLEERSTLLKKIDTLEKDLQKEKECSGENKKKHGDNIQQIHELKILIESISSQRQRFRSEANDLKFELTKIRNQKHILEQNLDSITKFNEERRNFRKQLNQKDIQYCQLKDKISSLQSQIAKLKSHNQDIQKTTRQKSMQLKNAQKDFNSMLKQNGILQRDLSDKQMKISSLMQDLQLQMKRIKFYEAQIAQIQEQYQSKYLAIERELRQSNNYKAMLEQQVQKLNRQLQISNNQLSVTMKDVQELEQMVTQKNEEIQNLESQMIQINTLSQQWQMEKIQLAQENKELQQKYNSLVEQSQKQIKKLNQNIVNISQQAEKQVNLLENSLSLQNQANTRLKLELKEKEQHISILQQSNLTLQKELEQSFAYRQRLISKQEGLHHEYRQKISQLQKQIKGKNQMIDNCIKSNQSQRQNHQKQIKLLTQNIKRLKDESAQFQEQVYLSISILSSHIKEASVRSEIDLKNEMLNQKVNQVLSESIQRNKQSCRNARQKEQKIKRLQQQIKFLQEQQKWKQQNLLTTSINFELLKKSTSEFSDQIIAKNKKIAQLNHLIREKDNQILEIQEQCNKKIIAVNSNVISKNMEVQQWKKRYQLLQEALQAQKPEIISKNQQITKLQKEKKSIETELKGKMSLLQSTLRGQIQKVNALQHNLSQIQKQLRLQKQNVRKLMRELQNKCHQFDQQSLQLEQNEQLCQLKDSQIRKLKEINGEYKIIFDAIFQSDPEFNVEQNFSNPKIEKYLNDPSMKQSEFLRQKVRLFYDNYLNLLRQSSMTSLLNASVQSLTQQLQTLQHQHKTDRNNYNLHLQEMKLQQLQSAKAKQKEYQVKVQLMKTYDDVRQNLDLLRKFIDQLLKLIINFQKQKKISVFVLTPVKQVMRKIDEQSAFLIKNMNTTYNKNKRQWDLASLREKKNPSKKIETIINSMKSI